MIVTIHLSKELDAGLRQPVKVPGELNEYLAQHKLVPRALFPNTGDIAPERERIWLITCDDAKVTDVVEDLLAIPGVEAAYMKPQDELPEPP